MLVIKDAMVLIHLAKLTLLEVSCGYFKSVAIPEMVRDEVLNDDYEDAVIIKELIKKKQISVKKVKNKKYIRKANQLNMQRGEAEAIALYWEEHADLLATDDDNVRKKRDSLNLHLIGTPAILLQLLKKNKISKERATESLKKLKSIGWFSSTIYDKITLEMEKNG